MRRKIEIRVAESSTLSVGVCLEDLVWASHFGQHALTWRPAPERRRYSDHIANLGHRDELLPSEDGLLTISALLAHGGVDARLEGLLASQRLSRECVVEEGRGTVTVVWTDGVTNVATRIVALEAGVVVELEYSQLSTSKKAWDPLARDVSDSLLAAVSELALLRGRGWPAGTAVQEVW